MIRGLHGMFHSSDANASRAFIRDKLRLPFTDVGGGWLIFDLPESDVGVHPADADGGNVGSHDVSFYCDDIAGTVADLKARGVSFKHEPMDQGYGWVTHFEIPGGIEVQLYEPKYQKRRAVATAARRATKPSAATKKKTVKKPVKKPVKTKKSAAPKTKGGRKKRR